jgi:hypothetical protein
MNMNRPIPPETLGQFVGDFPLTFAVALDMPLWVKHTFLEPDSKLFNQDHYHLFDFMDGQIGFLWASTGYSSKGRFVIGQTEQLLFRCNKWQKWRQEQQMHEWFGLVLPEFIITLDAEYWSTCGHNDACALIEHELYHIAHAKDQFGMPAFNRDTGLAKLEIRGHEVEEFIGVVRRYGTGHPEGKLAQLVKAANDKPEIANIDIAHACGTCLRLVA